eukprot:snap_masked-scaffold268_size230776-processed-gene-1.1 protein:Tk11110 transcript:snap_masked-scaffold268_size230776-processed-gene-1.1-mRNA-1 annotation:"glutathione s-transferase c-terminal domain-containing protein"
MDLLGYQGNCLSAPAEVSAWTEFCEVSIPQALEKVLKDLRNGRERNSPATPAAPDGFHISPEHGQLQQIILPIELAKYEVHLQQPVRMHNIRKRMQRSEPRPTPSVPQSGGPGDSDARNSQIGKEALMVLDQGCEKILNSLTGMKLDSIEDFARNQHIYAEGPDYLLSDVLLYTYYYLLEKYWPGVLDIVPRTRTWFQIMSNTLRMETRLDRWVNVDSSLTHPQSQPRTPIPINSQVGSEATNNLSSLDGKIYEQSERQVMILDGFQVVLPSTRRVSLYKSDPSRQNPNAKTFTRQYDIDRVFQWFSQMGLNSRTDLLDIRGYVPAHESAGESPSQGTGEVETEMGIDWSRLPHLVHPLSGMLPEKRLLKKCQQLENLANAVLDIVANIGPTKDERREAIRERGQQQSCCDESGPRPECLGKYPPRPNLHGESGQKKGDNPGLAQTKNASTDIAISEVQKQTPVIVDFCSGGGHLGILLAYLLPQAQIYLVENKDESLRRAFERVECLGLSNVGFFQCNLDYFTGHFDVGVSLHACGVATDLVLKACLDNRAAFVCCPCCYGSVQENHIIDYPKSKAFQRMGWNFKDYLIVGHTADQTHPNHSKTAQGLRAMDMVDSDRVWEAIEKGYQVKLSTLNPPSCTPKNNLLVGTWNRSGELHNQ